MITTDINKWLADIALEGYSEIEDLYACVSQEINMNLFHISVNENAPRRLFITPVERDLDTLMITDNSKPMFFRELEDKYCNGMDVEAYCSMEHELEKDD